MQSLNWLTARQAADGLGEGRFSATALAQACLDQIAAREPEVGAWTYLDPEQVLAQARRADEARAAGRRLGHLHGLPVGIKDIIDTADMPTENGTSLHAGRRSQNDARLVELLRAAGAVIMGKTVTTELATYAPGKTRNPHDLEHTPGGSSSGSAAAVAAGMVPLALGTQTNGSVIRPASFCGVFGFKPSRGLLSCRGILRQSPSLDQPGLFARSVEDLALLGEALMEAAPDSHVNTALLAVCAEEPPTPPRLAFVRTSLWPRADDEVRGGLEKLVARLRAHVKELPTPVIAESVLDWHKTVMEADIAANYAAEYEQSEQGEHGKAGAARLSASLRDQIERGRAIAAGDYRAALARIPEVTAALDSLFGECDAIITPAVAGAAPRGLDSTGSPMFCTLWTFCGMPAISLPLLRAGNDLHPGLHPGLPIGVQLVGRVGDDARLLRTARWLTRIALQQ